MKKINLPKNPDNRIGKAIKKGLEKKEMAQKDLSISMGVNKSTVCSWISGNIIPPGDKLLKMMKDLDILPELFPEYDKEALLLRESQVNSISSELMQHLQVLTDKMEVLEKKLANIEKKLGD